MILPFLPKPSPIQAVQWTGQNAAELSNFVGPPAVEFRPSRSVVAVVQPLGGPERYCLPVGFWVTRDRSGGCAVWDKESFEVAHDPAD